MSTDTGGPAFPCHPDSEINSPYDGMTLRDYFAAKVMQGLISMENAKPLVVAGIAYSYADAMLKARKQ